MKLQHTQRSKRNDTMEPSNANTLSITKVEDNNNNHHHCHHQNNPNGISSSNKKQKRVTVEEPCRRSMRIRVRMNIICMYVYCVRIPMS